MSGVDGAARIRGEEVAPAQTSSKPVQATQEGPGTTREMASDCLSVDDQWVCRLRALPSVTRAPDRGHAEGLEGSVRRHHRLPR